MKLPFTFVAIEKLLQDSQWELLQFLRMILTPIPYNTDAEFIAKLERLTDFFTASFTSRNNALTHLICLDHILCVFVSNDISFEKLQMVAADLSDVYQARLTYLHQQYQEWDSKHDNFYEKSITTDPSHYPVLFIHNSTLTQCIEVHDKKGTFFSGNKKIFTTTCLPVDSSLLTRAACAASLHTDLPIGLELFFKAHFNALTAFTHINNSFFHSMRELIYNVLIVLRAQPDIKNIVSDRRGLIAEWMHLYHNPNALIHYSPTTLIRIFHIGLISQVLIQQEIMNQNSAFSLLMKLLLRHGNKQDLVNIGVSSSSIFCRAELNSVPFVKTRLLELDTAVKKLNIYPLPTGLDIYSDYLLPQQEQYAVWFTTHVKYNVAHEISNRKYTHQKNQLFISNIFSKHQLIVEPIPKGLTLDKHNWKIIISQLYQKIIRNRTYLLDCIHAIETYEGLPPQTCEELIHALQFADDPPDLQRFIVRERTKIVFFEHSNQLIPPYLGFSYYIMLHAIASTISDLIIKRAYPRYKEESLKYKEESYDLFKQESQFHLSIRQIVDAEIKHAFARSLPCTVPSLSITDFFRYIEFTYENNIDLCNPGAMERASCQIKNRYDLVRYFCQQSEPDLKDPFVIKVFEDITKNDSPTYTVKELDFLVTFLNNELKNSQFLSGEQLDELCRKIPEKISNFFIYRERQLQDNYHKKTTALLPDWQIKTDNIINIIYKKIADSPVLFKSYCHFILQKPCVTLQHAQFLEHYYSKIMVLIESQTQRENFNAACEPIWLNKIECFKARLLKVNKSKPQSQCFALHFFSESALTNSPSTHSLKSATSSALNFYDIQNHYISELNKLVQWLNTLPVQPKTLLLSLYSRPPFKNSQTRERAVQISSLIKQIQNTKNWKELEHLVINSIQKQSSAGDWITQHVRLTFANAMLPLIERNHELIESSVFQSVNNFCFS